MQQGGLFVYKGYSKKARHQLTATMRQPTFVYQAVLDNVPENFPGYEKLLRKKRAEYENQYQPFYEMTEDSSIARWLSELTLWSRI